MTALDLLISQTVAGFILDTGIPPSTTLSQTITGGAGTITATVADSSAFVIGGTVGFDDGTQEELYPISAIDPVGNILTIDVAGTGVTGYQFSHVSGVTVYTNLLTEIPLGIAPMFNKGNPVIYVHVTAESEQRWGVTASGAVTDVYSVRIEYHRPLNQPQSGGTPMAAMTWARRQQVQARTDLDTIATKLRDNETLARPAHSPALVMQLGETGNPNRPNLAKTWKLLTVSQDVPHFFGTIDAVYTASRYILPGA